MDIVGLNPPPTPSPADAEFNPAPTPSPADAEHRTPNTEHRTSHNAQRTTHNAQRTTNPENRTSHPAPRTPNPESRTTHTAQRTTHNVGDSASFTKTVTESDIDAFAAISGDDNPVHLDNDFARQTPFGRRIAHGMLTASFISTVLGTKIPGVGAIYVAQTLRFLKPVFIGDTVTTTATITSYDRDRDRMKLSTVCTNQHGDEVLTGEADILYRPITSP